MSILPENKPKTINNTPRIYFIWGESMSGKTYLARKFPSPILLNTDGNAAKVDTPSVEIKDFKQFNNVLVELEKGNHTFKTIIIDLIDDIEIMLKQYIIDLANEALKKINRQPISSIGEIPFGQGYSKFSSTWASLMMRLSNIGYNVIFISHIMEKVENNNSIIQPSLPQKALNVCLGRCDLQIQTKKIANNYMQIITNKRDNYKKEDIKDPIILEALNNVIGLFEKK